MLSRSELNSLKARREYPSVSILAPTHRTAPSNKQDPIRVKNLVRKAINRLHGEFSKRDVAAVVKNLQQLVREVDWEHTLDGLALFARREQSAAVNLPFRVKPRAVIDETFATRDLVYAFNRAPPYRVLVLSQKSTLYDGWTHVLDEHKARPFPMVHRGPGGASKLPGGQGINPSAVRDQAHRNTSGGWMMPLAPCRRPILSRSSWRGWNGTWPFIARSLVNPGPSLACSPAITIKPPPASWAS
jgi:hypothetical protein